MWVPKRKQHVCFHIYTLTVILLFSGPQKKFFLLYELSFSSERNVPVKVLLISCKASTKASVVKQTGRFLSEMWIAQIVLRVVYCNSSKKLNQHLNSRAS